MLNESYLKTRRRKLVEKAFPTKIREELIIDFFKENNQLDYTVSEIARGVDGIYNSIKYHIQQMEMEGTLVRVREMGNGYTYQLKEWLNQDREKEKTRAANYRRWTTNAKKK